MADTMYQSTLYDIANDACEKAFVYASRELKTMKGGRSAFYPRVNTQKGTVGIGVIQPYHYLVYQEKGFASFPMKWAYGRVVKMLVDGKFIYRKCTNLNQFRTGTRVYWGRQGNGHLISHTAQKRSWVHPGLGPKRFMRDAVKDAVRDGQEELDRAIIADKYEELENKMDRRLYGGR
jgi:hypothetical protein